MKRRSWIVCITLLLGGQWLCARVSAQREVKAPDVAPAPESQPWVPPPRTEEPASAIVDDVIWPTARGIRWDPPEPGDVLPGLVKRWKAAKDAPAKAAVEKQMTRLLDYTFDKDLTRREKEVSEIENRVRKLREQIEKRKKAKQQIIELRLKTVINEAEGLGFPSLGGEGEAFSSKLKRAKKRASKGRGDVGIEKPPTIGPSTDKVIAPLPASEP